MTRSLIPVRRAASPVRVPVIIEGAGSDAIERFVEFFVVTIRNPNTRAAYAKAVGSFSRWCSRHGLVSLEELTPVVVAAWVEESLLTKSAPTVKQHLAATRMLFDWLVMGHVLQANPASSVRGPKHVVKKGKTPVLTSGDCRLLLESIDTARVAGLRDRALIATMVYSFARVSATVGMNIGDFRQIGTRWTLRLHEKGGKYHEVPAHHRCAEYLDSYVEATACRDTKRAPLFRTLQRSGELTELRMGRGDALRMVKRRAAAAGLSGELCCHSFRATGITAYLEAGGTLENAQAIAAHESPRTTRLYDRRSDAIELDEIERIQI